MNDRAGIVICGAGIAGIAAAYHLAARHGVRNVTLIDERDPMTLTSDKGTQAYRNWWPGPDDTMLRFVSRSIDIMEEMAEESGNQFRLSRRGYLFVTGADDGVEKLRTTAQQVSSYGMGPLRTHPGPEAYAPAAAEGFRGFPVGADLLLGGDAHAAFPYIARETKAALHIRRAGWFNGVALGSWMLKRAMAAGVTFVRDRIVGVDTRGGEVRSVRLESGGTIETERLVIAAGPALPAILQMLSIELPVFNELHAKLTLRDPRGAVPRDAPFLIWIDGMELSWSDEERARLSLHDDSRKMLAPYPGGVHVRPVDGPYGDELYLIWTFDVEPTAPIWPPVFDPNYAEVVVRGSIRMVPAMAAYIEHSATGIVDGGYYCKTIDNRPLVGPLAVSGAYVIGAISGYGLMASHACADLLATHLAGGRLPDYAKWFLPSRFEDPEYLALIEQWGALVGQL